MKTIQLNPDEHIIAVVPAFAAGPGWSNQPLWVYIEQSATKKLRTECIQPDEQTPEMRALFAPGAAMAAALVRSVPAEEVAEKPVAKKVAPKARSASAKKTAPKARATSAKKSTVSAA
jgi:hypothetical protein